MKAISLRLASIIRPVYSDWKTWCNPSNVRQMAHRYRTELFVFILFAVAYSILAISVWQTGLLTPPDGERHSGSFLGYDNYDRFINRGGLIDVSHPLVVPWQVLRGIILMRLLGPELNLLVMTLLMALFVGASVAGVFAYCKRIVGLGVRESFFLCSLTALSFTSLTLCFAIESYPQSMFLLIASLCALSREKIRYGYYRKRTVWVFAFLTGGLTLTNVAKPASAFLIDGNLRNGIRKLIPLAITFSLLCLLMILTYMLRDYFFKGESFWAVMNGVKNLGRFVDIPAGQDTFAAFFAQPLIISKLGFLELYTERVLRPLPYDSFFYYIPPILAAGLMVAGIVRARRYPIVWLLPIYFGIDLIVNVVFRYGLPEAIIFGGHWVFLFPMSVAFLLRESGRKERMVYTVLLAGILLIMILQNIPVVLQAFIP